MSNKMSNKGLAGFVIDRNEAIFSFDRYKIETFCKKYGIELPDSDWAFWLGICESILSVPDAPGEAKAKAREWIRANYIGDYGEDVLGLAGVFDE